MKIKYLFFFINIVSLFFADITFASDLPDWVITPKKDGYSICVTGSSVNNNSKSMQLKIARMNAMSELSKIREVQVDNQLNIKQSSTSANGKIIDSSKEISSKSRQYSSSVLNDVEDVAEYLDNETGIFYILICIK